MNRLVFTIMNNGGQLGKYRLCFNLQKLELYDLWCNLSTSHNGVTESSQSFIMNVVDIGTIDW